MSKWWPFYHKSCPSLKRKFRPCVITHLCTALMKWGFYGRREFLVMIMRRSLQKGYRREVQSRLCRREFTTENQAVCFSILGRNSRSTNAVANSQVWWVLWRITHIVVCTRRDRQNSMLIVWHNYLKINSSCILILCFARVFLLLEN